MEKKNSNCFSSILFLGLLCHLVGLSLAASGGGWSYEGDTGPANWKGACAAGRTQSPIDISRTGNPVRTEMPFNFVNYDVTPKRSYLDNTGYTVKLGWKPVTEDQVPKVSGGGLPSTYAFAQAHFHWGTSDGQGSEHTISKVSYPLELHFVHYNTKYGNNLGDAIADGQGASDTLAVLGVMFQLHSKPNPELEPIIQAMESTKDQGSSADTSLFPLQDLLPRNLNNFYRYNGSLTTPGCNEIVVWTLFSDPVDISSRQMARFREVSKSTPLSADNFRPTQPLNGRTVFEIKAGGEGSGAGAGASASISAVLFSVFVMKLVE